MIKLKTHILSQFKTYHSFYKNLEYSPRGIRLKLKNKGTRYQFSTSMYQALQNHRSYPLTLMSITKLLDIVVYSENTRMNFKKMYVSTYRNYYHTNIHSYLFDTPLLLYSIISYNYLI